MNHRPEDLWERHRGELKAFVLRRVRSTAEAEDIVQDVFVKMLAALKSPAPLGNPRAWLFAVARNAVADHFRTRRPTQALSDELARVEDGPNAREEIGACLAPLVAALPPALREALVLADLEGVGQRLVAKRLGISLPAAKSRVQRGRRRLRGLIEDCCRLEMDARGSIMGFVSKSRCCAGAEARS